MCKFLKSRLFFFMLGIVIASTISVFATLTYNASQIVYTKNNLEMPLSNVIDELYSSASTIGNIEYIGFDYNGRNQGGTASTIALSKSVSTAGNYLIILARASSNGGNTNSNLGGTLSGCDSSQTYNNLFTNTGFASSSSPINVANLKLKVLKCAINSAKTINYTSESTDDDMNIAMLVFKIR